MSKVFRDVYTRYLRDVRTLSGLMPAEYRSLAELLEEYTPGIRLRDGSIHLFSRDELERMASQLPWYLHGLVKLPLVVVKEGDHYRLVCDKWSLRAASLLLRGELALNPDPLLRLGEVERLIDEYHSLVFVTLKAEETGLGEGEPE